MQRRILFVCHGNICRSPMAEFILKELVSRVHAEESFFIESAAVSSEEIGNPVYPPVRQLLRNHGIGCHGKTARKMTIADYENFDLLICMDEGNLRRMRKICGGDPDMKMRLMLSFAGENRDVDDPWYSGDFRGAWNDILRGCASLLKALGYPAEIQDLEIE